MAMTPRERLIAALNHREPDRVPIDLGGTEQTGICKLSYIDLMNYLGWEVGEAEVGISNIVQQLAVIDPRLLERLEVDTRPLISNPPSYWSLELIEEPDGSISFWDEWGGKLTMPPGGYYYDWTDFSIKEPTFEGIRNYKWPDPDDPARVAGMRDKALDLYHNTDYAIVGSCLFAGGIFEHPARIMGMEEFLMTLSSAGDLKFADYVMERMTEIFVRAYQNFLDEVGDLIQVITYWDDLAHQYGPIMHPDIYRQYIKPKQKRLFEAIKAKTGAKIYFHGCGATYEFIPDLIEIGVDILNPVQVSAAGMEDTAKLKREFGRDLTFWGGVVGPQHTLPFGTAEDVRQEARRRIEDLAPGGGFVCAPVHNIQNFVPPENILALFDMALEYGVY